MRVLVLSSSEKTAENLSDLVKKADSTLSPTAVTSASKARRMVLDESWDLILVNLPLKDDNGIDFSSMVSANTDTPVIALTKEEYFSSIGPALRECGVITLTKPLMMPVFQQALTLSMMTNAKLDALKRENRKLQAKLEEEKVISKAKCVLIEKRGLTEEEAHHHIERKAMNGRMSRRDAALSLLRLYSED